MTGHRCSPAGRDRLERVGPAQRLRQPAGRRRGPVQRQPARARHAGRRGRDRDDARASQPDLRRPALRDVDPRVRRPRRRRAARTPARRNGIPGLEVVSPDEVERAAELFHRDGFVAVRDAMPPDQLERLRAAAADVIETLFAADPEGAVGGGAGGLPHRYSFGGTSATRHMFHRPEWCELLDMPTTTPILTAIFGSPNYIVYGAGGDLALPGAIEYQGLHSDNVWSELHDPVGGVTMRDLPVPSCTSTSRSSTSRPRTGRSGRSPAPTVHGHRSRGSPTSRSGCGSARSARCRPARRSSATPAAGTAARPTCRGTSARCRTSSTSRRGSAARR